MPRRFVTLEEFQSEDFEFDEQTVDSLAQVAMQIARERAEVQREIKELLERGDDQKALKLMRKHLGVVMPRKPPEKKTTRASRSK